MNAAEVIDLNNLAGDLYDAAALTNALEALVYAWVDTKHMDGDKATECSRLLGLIRRPVESVAGQLMDHSPASGQAGSQGDAA